MSGKLRHPGGDVGEDQRTSRGPDHQDAKHETEVPDAVGDEGLLCRLGCRRTLEPMPNEQIGAEPDQFPEDKHHHEIVREDDPEHGEHEERKSGEIARLALVRAHVA